MKAKCVPCLLLVIAGLLADAGVAEAQTTAFTYQGQLLAAGLPANGYYDFRFNLFPTNTGGTVVGSLNSINGLQVSNGLFTVVLDFGTVINGASFWLEIGVRTNGFAGGFTTLAPRQNIAASPYSIYSLAAGNVTGVLSVANLPTNVALLNGNETFTGTVTASNLNGNFNGSFNGNFNGTFNNSTPATIPLGESTVGALNNVQPVTPYATPFKTPAMGWMSWNDYGNSGATETNVMRAAIAFTTNGLLKAGYNLLQIDAGWAGWRDTNGVVHENLTAFPDGMGGTVAKLHAMGFKVGLWTGITPADTNSDFVVQTGNGATNGAMWPPNFPYAGTTNQLYATNLNYLTNDAATFAKWGIDYVKLEAFYGPYAVFGSTALEQQWVTSFVRQGQQMGHPFYMMGALGWTNWGVGWFPWMYGIYQAPRCGNFDVGSWNGAFTWGQIMSNMFWALPLQTNRSQGSFVSLDVIASSAPLQQAQGQQIVFSMLGSELIWSDVGYYLSVMTNANLIAIDQDIANNPCYPIATNGAVITLMRPLGSYPNQTLAFAFVNTAAGGGPVSGATLYWSNYFQTTNLMILDAVSNIQQSVNSSFAVSVPAMSAYCYLVSAPLNNPPYPGLAAMPGGVRTSIASMSANYSLGNQDGTILVAASGLTITLPPANSPTVGSGREYTVKLTAAGSCTVTNGTGSQTIDGALSYTLTAQNKYLTVQSDGTQWWIIGNN